jgi:DNA repair protein RadD
VFANWPNTGKIIVLTHVQELVQQDYDSIKWVWPGASVSLFSSGLKQKDLTGRTIVAGVQSFASVAHEVENPSIVIIDECHMIPMSGETLYRKTIDVLRQANPKLVVIGLTATPFRMKGGHLLDCGLFNHVACDFSSKETFLRFVNEGYLAKLTTKATSTQFDLSQVGEVAGEYNLKQLAGAVDQYATTVECCKEMIAKGSDRKKWLIFAASIEHATHIAEILNDMGIRTGVVHSKMKGQREEAIHEFKHGNTRALVNMGCLTTGFDMPNIDMLVLMRPTKSVSLHIQILGRGTRPVFAPGFDLSTIIGRLAAIAAGIKANGCLVLDFASNILRLGPINDPKLPGKKKKGGGSDAPPCKICPVCDSYCATRAKECDDCGHQFPPPELEVYAGSSEQAAIAGMEPGAPQALDVRELPVDMVGFSLYQKQGKSPSIRAVYHCGLTTYSTWLCFEHKGSARKMAVDWWKANTGLDNCPATCDDFLGRKAELQKPVSIRVWFKDKYPEILSQTYQETPA